MTVEWDPPVDPSPYYFYFYKVELLAENGGGEVTASGASGDITTTSLRILKFPGFPPLDLDLNKEYTVRVTARNTDGNNLYGPEALLRVTAYMQPAALPAAPSVLSVTTSSVSLQWLVPTSSGTPSEELRYRVSHDISMFCCVTVVESLCMQMRYHSVLITYVDRACLLICGCRLARSGTLVWS